MLNHSYNTFYKLYNILCIHFSLLLDYHLFTTISRTRGQIIRKTNKPHGCRSLIISSLTCLCWRSTYVGHQYPMLALYFSRTCFTTPVPPILGKIVLNGLRLKGGKQQKNWSRKPQHHGQNNIGVDCPDLVSN